MLSKKEMLIIAYLRENARESLTNISKRTKIPISTIFEKLRTNYNGIIKKNVVLIDFGLLGYTVRANIMLATAKESRNSLREFLVKQYPVNSIYKVNNGYDYLVEGVFRDIREVEDFVESVEESFRIEKKMVNYIIEDVKREAFLADPKTIEIFN
jgi:DNA-binding Lrp family transcriptional regulator